MKIHTKVRYGFRAMVEIALNQNQGGVLQKDIAKRQEISNKYLDHIIHALKVAKLIRKKPRKSGYELTRDTSKITLLDIHNAFEPGIYIVECLVKDINCSMEKDCLTRDFWCDLNSVIIDQFKSVTLQDLVNKEMNKSFNR